MSRVAQAHASRRARPIALAALLVLPSAGYASADEMRGLWVVRTGLVSPAMVDQVVDQAAAGGFNALFVQVRGRGDAFYDARRAPRSLLLAGQPAAFDPLGRLIERARRRGLHVHAWVNVLLTGGFGAPLPAGHVLTEHPEWAMVPRAAARAALTVPRKGLLWLIRKHGQADPDTEGYYLSPAAAGVPAYLEGVVRELVRGYPLEGVHLDFIRYPGREWDYSPAALEEFQRVRPRRGVRDLLALPGLDPDGWAAFRRDTLTALADRLAAAARAERPGLLVSAAVVPDEAVALTQKYQDWPSWLSRGTLDAVCPMAYTPDVRLFRRHVERARMLAGVRRPVWAGVGAYKLDLAGVIEQIGVAREAGAAGVVVFSQESLAAGDWARLRASAFASAAADAPAMAPLRRGATADGDPARPAAAPPPALSGERVASPPPPAPTS